jgi:methylglyoxal synthase
MSEGSRIALIAHDARKAELADWAQARRAQLSQCTLMATGTTGLHVMERCPELKVERLLSGPLGGDQQIGSRIAEDLVDALIVFIDPLSAMPYEPSDDVQLAATGFPKGRSRRRSSSCARRRASRCSSVACARSANSTSASCAGRPDFRSGRSTLFRFDGCAKGSTSGCQSHLARGIA